MRLFLVSLLLVYSIEAFRPPVIHVEEHIVQEHKNIGKFVELTEHQEIVLKCSGPHDDLEFKYPDMKEHYGYNTSYFDDRIEEVNDDDLGDRVLTISDVRESDTGTYSCVSLEHPSLNDTIYIFVHAKKTFLPLTALGFEYNEGEVMVPCRTTKFVEDKDIELYANDALIKSAFKNYDQRIGFKITPKMAADIKPIKNVKFECRHKKESNQIVDYLISEKESGSASENDYKFYWDKGFEWPHVGYNYTLICRVTYNGTNLNNFAPYKHTLKVECPQCLNGHVTPIQNKLDHGRGLMATIPIDHLELEDSGLYKCIWTYEHGGVKEIEYDLQVAPKKAQIKVVDRSPQILRAMEDHEITLDAKFAIYPIDGEKYTAKWSRRYNSSIKAGTQSETIISDDFRTITSESYENGVFSETLNMNKAAVTANMSGTYILSISHLDTVQVIQWEVAIENDKPDVQITIREPSSFIVFNQQFYPPDTHLHIDCVSVSIPPADVVFEQKNSQSSEFEEIDPSVLVRVDGTFERGYIWNMTLNKDTELRCSSEKRGKKSSTTKSIIVANEAPKVYSSIEKSEKATDSEDAKVIYEGDIVILTCVVPTGASDWNVFWRLTDSSESFKVEVREEGLSKHVILRLEGITTEISGNYVCVVQKDDSEELLGIDVTVEDTSKPYHTNADSRHVVTVDFDETFVIDCHMAGNPTPNYYWFKNGNPYTAGEKDGSMLKVTRARAEDDGQFHCLATNRAGSTSHFIEVQVEGAPKGSSFFYWLTAIISTFCIAAVLVLIYKLRATKRITKQKDIALNNLYRSMMEQNVGPLPEDMKELPIEERTYYLPYNTDYEINNENLEILEPLGSGHFGVVRKGYLQMADPKSQIEYKTRLPVAVKSSTNPYDIELQQMMIEELKVMGAIPKHPNVLALIGAVTANIRQGQLLIVTEYIDGGSLREYLQNHRNGFVNELVEDSVPAVDDSYMVPNSVKKKIYKFDEKSGETDRLLAPDTNSLCTSDLLSFGLQIANGMEWLANIPCVHRDLACRNVLVTKSKIIRIADFGLAKRHTNKNYYRVKKNKDTPLPVRWMPLESIENLKFTQKSDVWSFGICLYELFTLGSTPYPALDTLSVINFIREGKRNSQPEYCHDDVYELMKLCWQASPKDRPTFSGCVQYLKNHMNSCAKELLDRVDNMLHMEREEQLKLDDWISKERTGVPGDGMIKRTPKKQQADERYLIVESHA